MESRMLVAITLTVTITVTSALNCYQCSISPLYNESKRLCVHFDYSSKYIVDCPFSTMCMKQEITLAIQNGVEIKAVQRDCAQQKHEFQQYIGKRWEPMVEVLEPYEEGCQVTDDKGERTSPASYCYCRGHLCNAAPPTTKESFHTDAMAVIVVFNLLKYIRSLR